MRGGFKVIVSGLALVAVTLAGASTAAAQEPAAAPAEPAKPVLTLNGDAAIITLLIKPDKTADFEFVLNKLKEALNKSEKPERKQQAAGWKVFKSSQMAQGNAVYLMRIDPVVKGQEYDISRLIAEVFPVEVQEIFAKYKDAFAGRAITEMTRAHEHAAVANGSCPGGVSGALTVRVDDAVLRPLLALLILVPLFQASAPLATAFQSIAQAISRPPRRSSRQQRIRRRSRLQPTSGLIVVPVHAAKTADYEAVIVALQAALSKAEDSETRALAAGWRVFKSADTDAKSNALYIHLLAPAVPESTIVRRIWLDKLLGGAPPELLTKYRDAFAGAPSKLGLVELAHMSVTPVTKPGNMPRRSACGAAETGNGSSLRTASAIH